MRMPSVTGAGTTTMRRTRRIRVHHSSAFLSVFAGALLVSTPRSDALLASPRAAQLPPAAIARASASASATAAAAAAAGRGAHDYHRGRHDGTGMSATASSTFVGGILKQRPASSGWRCAAPGPVCSSSNSRGSRRSRSGLLAMSSVVGGEEGGGGGEGEAIAGEEAELGVVVEGGRRSLSSSGAAAAAAEGEQQQKQQQAGGVVTTRCVRACVCAVTAVPSFHVIVLFIPCALLCRRGKRWTLDIRVIH